jgi:hypothetical protein
MSVVTICFLIFTITAISLHFPVASAHTMDQVDLKEVQTLTFFKDKLTTGKRSSGIPQLNCLGGSASAKNDEIESVQCQNMGLNDVDEVQWKCNVDLDDKFRLTSVVVSCEGYRNANDKYKLAGSSWCIVNEI